MRLMDFLQTTGMVFFKQIQMNLLLMQMIFGFVLAELRASSFSVVKNVGALLHIA